MLKVSRFLAPLMIAAMCVVLVKMPAQDEAAARRAAIEGMYPVMLGALEARSFGRARNICEQAIVWEPQNPTHHYNLACIEAQAGGSRIPHAWSALELAIALGFTDANHLQTDPDLIPLHGDPRFADLVSKVTQNASAAAAQAAIAFFSQPSLNPARETRVARSENPTTTREDMPHGVYFMTRYDASKQRIEREVWYFANGAVFRDLKEGVDMADPAAHARYQGKVRVHADELRITWSDGDETASSFERDGAAFIWGMGLFVPVNAFAHVEDVAGVYDTIEDFEPRANGPLIVQRLQLNSDGSFRWYGGKFVRGPSGSVTVSAEMNAETSGVWKLDGFSLELISSEGMSLRRLAFPQDEEKTIVRPDRMFVGGVLFKRRP